MADVQPVAAETASRPPTRPSSSSAAIPGSNFDNAIDLDIELDDSSPVAVVRVGSSRENKIDLTSSSPHETQAQPRKSSMKAVRGRSSSMMSTRDGFYSVSESATGAKRVHFTPSSPTPEEEQAAEAVDNDDEDDGEDYFSAVEDIEENDDDFSEQIARVPKRPCQTSGRPSRVGSLSSSMSTRASRIDQSYDDDDDTQHEEERPSKRQRKDDATSSQTMSGRVNTQSEGYIRSHLLKTVRVTEAEFRLVRQDYDLIPSATFRNLGGTLKVDSTGNPRRFQQRVTNAEWDAVHAMRVAAGEKPPTWDLRKGHTMEEQQEASAHKDQALKAQVAEAKQKMAKTGLAPTPRASVKNNISAAL